MYLALALAAAAAYGAADFFGGLANRHARILPVVFVSQGAALALVLAVAPFFSTPNGGLGWGALAGLSYGVGLVLLYRGLARGRMSVVAPITGVCALGFPAMFGILVGERPGTWALVGIGLAVAAIVLVSQQQEAGRADHAARGGRAVVLMAIGAGIAFGIFLVLFAHTPKGAGLWPLAMSRIVAVFGYGLLAFARRESLRLARAPLRLAVAGGLLDVVANTLYVLAVRGAGQISLAATLTALYPAATVLLAAVVLRERIRVPQAAGLACAVVAAVLITAGR